MRKKEFEAFAIENGLDVEKAVKEVEEEIKRYGTNWNSVYVSVETNAREIGPLAIFTASGYRKRTTGEYVSSAYRSKFGWKNTYYEKARLEITFTKKPRIPSIYF